MLTSVSEPFDLEVGTCTQKGEASICTGGFGKKNVQVKGKGRRCICDLWSCMHVDVLSAYERTESGTHGEFRSHIRLSTPGSGSPPSIGYCSKILP